MTNKRIPVAVSMTADERDGLDRIAKERGTSRSGLVRSIFIPHMCDNGACPEDGTVEPGAASINHTVAAAKLRSVVAKLLGADSPSDTGYPPMSLDAYNLVLVVAGRHGKRMRAGSMPMMRDDVVAAGLDPDSKETWHLCMVVLPEFFRVLSAGKNPPAVEVLYEPLDTVDGQGSGSIEGVVESCGEVYPDNNTKLYIGMVLRTARQRVRVLAPTGCGGDNVAVGITVYAAGTFDVERRRVVMRAYKCVVRRVPGFDEVYAVARRWGVHDAVAGQAVAALQECHGASAPEFSQAFASYLLIDRATMPSGGMLQMPDDWSVKLYKSDIRAAPDGVDAFRWCALHWPSLARRNRNTISLW